MVVRCASFRGDEVCKNLGSAYHYNKVADLSINGERSWPLVYSNP